MANDEKSLDNLNKELANLGAQKPAAPIQKAKRARKKTATPKKQLVVTSKARRKYAVARASLYAGRAGITVNKIDIHAILPAEVRELILEPVNVSDITKEIVNGSSIKINVHGGGASGQAQAARSALAKVIAKAAPTDAVRKMYMDYDRTMVVDDVRQVEPKKYKGPKARARFQKSYR